MRISTAGDYVESSNDPPENGEESWYDKRFDSPPPGDDEESYDAEEFSELLFDFPPRKTARLKSFQDRPEHSFHKSRRLAKATTKRNRKMVLIAKGSNHD